MAFHGDDDRIKEQERDEWCFAMVGSPAGAGFGLFIESPGYQ
jgi:hypothetical protein